FNPADFPHGGERALGFNDQAGELYDAAAVLQHAKLAGAFEQMAEAMGGQDRAVGQRHHASKEFCSSSSFVSRRASMTPKRVLTRQPPRVTSGARWKWIGVFWNLVASKFELASCNKSRSSGCR